MFNRYEELQTKINRNIEKYNKKLQRDISEEAKERVLNLLEIALKDLEVLNSDKSAEVKEIYFKNLY